MKIVDNIYEVLQGERFTQEMTGFDFDTASQIVVLLYKVSDSSYSRSWVKIPSETYPNAEAVEKREDSKMVFTIDTTGLTTGKYEIEVRVDVVGVLAPIVKDRSEFLTVKQSRT